MRTLISISFIFIATVVDALLAAFIVMFNSFYVHHHWWDAIPAFDFSDSLIIGVLISCFAALVSTSGANTWITYLGSIFLSILIFPFLIPFVVGLANDNLLPAMPDISPGVVFVMGLVGLLVGLVKTIIVTVMNKFNDV